MKKLFKFWLERLTAMVSIIKDDCKVFSSELINFFVSLFLLLAYTIKMLIVMPTGILLSPLLVPIAWYLSYQDDYKKRDKMLDAVKSNPENIKMFAEQRMEVFNDPFYKRLKQMAENELKN